MELERFAQFRTTKAPQLRRNHLYKPVDVSSAGIKHEIRAESPPKQLSPKEYAARETRALKRFQYSQLTCGEREPELETVKESIVNLRRRKLHYEERAYVEPEEVVLGESLAKPHFNATMTLTRQGVKYSNAAPQKRVPRNPHAVPVQTAQLRQQRPAVCDVGGSQFWEGRQQRAPSEPAAVLDVPLAGYEDPACQPVDDYLVNVPQNFQFIKRKQQGEKLSVQNGQLYSSFAAELGGPLVKYELFAGLQPDKVRIQ